MDHTAVQAVPTLIVGLGGTGALAVQFVKRQMGQLLASLGEKESERLPFVSYLVLDAMDRQEEQHEKLHEDFVPMTHKNLTRAITSLEPRERRSALSWFPDSLDPGQINAGARGVRAIGRLCFFFKRPDIKLALNSRIHRITDYDQVSKELPRSIRLTPGLDVHIISSLCGGTGSSCLLDTVYLVRQAAEQITKLETSPVGHLVTTEPIEAEPNTDRESLRSNMLLTLAEIEHFSRKGGWNVRYLNGETVFAPATKPFSLTYLLGAPDGASRTRQNVCERIGEAIALSTLSPENGILRGRLGNMLPLVNETHDGDERRWYSSYNVRMLAAGMDKVTRDNAVATAKKEVCFRLLGESGDPTGDWEMFERNASAALGTTFAVDGFGEAVLGVRVDDEALLGAGQHITFPPKGGISIAGLGHRPQVTGTVLGMYRTEENRILQLCESRRRELTQSFNKLKTSVDNEMWRLLNELGLSRVLAVLLRVKERIAALDDALQRPEAVPAQTIEQIVDQAVPQRRGEAFVAGAKALLELTIKREIHQHVRSELSSLMSFVVLRQRWCDTARIFVTDVEKESTRQRRHRAGPEGASVWDSRSVEAEIGNGGGRLIKTYLRRLEAAAADTTGNPQRVAGLEFLRFFDKSETGRVQLAVRELGGAVDEFLSALQDDAIPYGRPGEPPERDVLSEARLSELVASAVPLWQIDRGGLEVRKVNVTNCPPPDFSEVGVTLQRITKDPIEFSKNESVTSSRLFWILMSEHGVPLRRLSSILDCVHSARRRFHREGHFTLNEISLDPGWRIEDLLDVEATYSIELFSLGFCFGHITETFPAFSFIDNGDCVSLTPDVTVMRPATRSEAFSNFLEQHGVPGGPVSRLKARIEEDLTGRRKSDVEGLKSSVKAHVDALCHLREKTTDARQNRWLGTEIRVVSGFLQRLGGIGGQHP